MQNASAEIEKAYSCQARRCVYRPKLCNFEYGDAADPVTEDEWKMLALVARYRPTRSMATGRLVSGQFRCYACMKKKSIIDHRKNEVFSMHSSNC